MVLFVSVSFSLFCPWSWDAKKKHRDRSLKTSWDAIIKPIKKIHFFFQKVLKKNGSQIYKSAQVSLSENKINYLIYLKNIIFFYRTCNLSMPKRKMSDSFCDKFWFNFAKFSEWVQIKDDFLTKNIIKNPKKWSFWTSNSVWKCSKYRHGTTNQKANAYRRAYCAISVLYIL